MTNPYQLLISNSFLTSLILYPKEAYVLDVMMLVGGYNKAYMFIIACIASIFGTLVNYYLGRLLRCADKFKSMADRVESIKYGEKLFLGGGYFLLLLGFLPLWGALITAASGVFRTNIMLFISLASLGIIGFYAVTIFYLS